MSRRAACWLSWSTCALSVGMAMLSVWFLVLLSRFPHDVIVDQWLENVMVLVVFSPVLAVVTVLSFSTMGTVIASRRPNSPIGWLFCTIGFVGGVRLISTEYAAYSLVAQSGLPPGGETLAWIASWLWVPDIALYLYLALLFPYGRLPSTRWRSFAWFIGVVVMIGTVAVALSPGPIRGLEPIENPLGLEGFPNVAVLTEALLYALAVVAMASVLVRLRRTSGVERQQIKWFTYAGVLLATSTVITYVLSEATSLRWLGWAAFVPAVVGMAGVPVAVGIAILRYRLYEIDLLINRTLVYGALSACVVLIYVLAVGGLGALLQARGDLGVSLLATGLVAVFFQPLRGRLQRGVNRLMYGERDDPYAVISRLGRRLEATLAPEAVLPTVVETIAQALKLPYTAILLKEGESVLTAAAYGSPTGEPEDLPLVYQREEIGRLVLSPRAPGEEFSEADRSLLEDLARQAEVAVHAVRLTTDLQHSRERLVATREEERRRLRRDLHDGLGAQLAGLNVQAGTLRRLIPRDPDAADLLVVELRDELRGAIADIRRLVYDLRPPALDDLGLVESLRHLAERHGSEDEQLRVFVEAPEDLPNLPAAVEVAIYRIVQEALTNVARHARARTSVVRLAVNEDVALEIVDDGVSIPAERSAGVGLSSMHERASELGGSCVVQSVPKGGTQVLVRLPLPKE